MINWLDYGYIWYRTSDLNRNYVLSTVPRLFWAHVVMDQLTKQKLCVIYYARLIKGSLCKQPVNKTRHYVLDNSLTWLCVNLIWDKWYNQKPCFGYSTEITLCSDGNGPVNNSRKYVWYFLLGLLRDNSITN